MNGFLTSMEEELQLKQQLSKSRQQTNIEIMNILNFEFLNFAMNFKFDLHIILLLVSVWADFDNM